MKTFKEKGFSYTVFYDELYYQYIWMFYPKDKSNINIKSLNEFLEKRFSGVVQFDKEKPWNGFHTEVYNDDYRASLIFLLDRKQDTISQISTISHECNHCALSLLYARGFRLDEKGSSEEAFCYYQDFLLRTFLDHAFPSLR